MAALNEAVGAAMANALGFEVGAVISAGDPSQPRTPDPSEMQ